MTGFEVVHRGMVLQDRTGSDGHARRLVGDVARLSDGRYMARWPFTNCDGTGSFGYREWAPGENVKKTVCGPPVDWKARFHDIVRDGTRNWMVLKLEVQDPEIVKFCQAWPAVSARLGLDVEPPPFRLFDPGPVTVPQNTPRGMFDQAAWWDYVNYHTAGEFGENGVIEEISLTDELEWTLHEKDVRVQNSAAIARQLGVVTSRYLLSDELQARFERPPFFPAGHDRKFLIELRTALGRGNETLATIVHVDS